MSTLVPIMIMASGATLMGACLGLRGCFWACLLSISSLVVGLMVIA